MTNITVLDSIMGSGKTTYVINMINQSYVDDMSKSFIDENDRPTKYIIVVPLLTEVERVISACPDLRFKEPRAIHGQKLYHLDQLVGDGMNIVTTHALFKLLNRSIYAGLKDAGYTLIIDEVLECVDLYTELTEADKVILFDQRLVFIDKTTRRLCWNKASYPDDGRFGTIKKLCDTGSLVVMDDAMLIWEFPSEFLSCFDHVIVCTYLFHGSTFSAYLEAEGFKIQMKSVREGKLVQWDPCANDHALKLKLTSLIDVYEGTMNNIGKSKDRTNPLSASWYKRQDSKVLTKLKSSCQTFFSNRHADTPSRYNGWTAFSSVKGALSGKGYARGWIPNNAKATNAFIEKRSMAYLCNWFYHPLLKRYFHERGVKVNEDAYALSAMLQWIWRSQIRRGDPIKVFIPSERMRTLFHNWLHDASHLQDNNPSQLAQRAA